MRMYLRFFLCLIIFLYFSQLVKAQYVSIPDANFRAYLQRNLPSCMQGAMLDTTCTGVITIRQMDVGDLNITDLTGVQYFDQLEALSCHNNQLTFLPRLPATLTVLDCALNLLQSLPALPSSLEVLFVHSNQLTSLPALPASLINLTCISNQLTTLPALPNGLLYLRTEWNQLTALPALPPTLIDLYCGRNQLTDLPSLPASLVTLSCYENKLSALPALPQGLEGLYCNQNYLSNLPMLPPYLISLNCGYNQLTSIPYLPQSLLYLNCASNKLTALPYLPSMLKELGCHKNQITCLPVLPNALITLTTDSLCRPNLPPNLIRNFPLNAPLCTDITYNYTRVCAGDTTTFIMINTNCSAFLWDFDDPVTGAQNTSTLQNPRHLFSHPGTFQVKLISYVSNPATVVTKTVTVDKLSRIDFGDDHSICPDDGIVLDAGNDFETYLWQDGSNKQSYQVKASGTYTVTATNACGSTTESVKLSDYVLQIPNLFTPNKDGHNDVFEIKGLNGDAGAFQVFNSWGAEVFHAEEYYNNWGGEELSDGIYYYSFALKNCPVQKGWVQIIR